MDTPAGNNGDGLSLKYRCGDLACNAEGAWEAEVGRTTLHVTIDFSLPVRSVSIFRDVDGHVRSDNLLTDGSPRQASSLKILGLEAIQFVIFALSSAPILVQVGCALAQVP